MGYFMSLTKWETAPFYSSDKVEWAKELLSLYEPESLRSYNAIDQV
jgi:hypothetical protein